MKHKFYVPIKITRKDKFKDLMRNRTTVDQGLTLKQIFCEVYSDFMEEYHNNQDNPRYKYRNGEPMSYIDLYYEQFRYLKRMMKQTRRNDFDFRWLSVVPVKRNQVNPATGKKVRPYLEYRYVNIRASQTPELLEEVNAIWAKQTKSTLKTLEEKRERLHYLSIPEGIAQAERARRELMDDLDERMRRTSMTREERQRREIERNRESSKVTPLKPEDLESYKTLDSFSNDDDYTTKEEEKERR